MSSLLNFLRHLFPMSPSQADIDEAYLADSVDLYELEHRMRLLDRRGRAPAWPLACGLFPR